VKMEAETNVSAYAQVNELPVNIDLDANNL
jgi:hypothetical protein